MVLLAFALGVAAGVGAVLGWPDPPQGSAPDPFRVDEHAVELLLFAVGTSGNSLHVDGAVFLSGAVGSTVLSVRSLDRSLAVRAPDLPVTVSPTARLQSVSLEIAVQDCAAARRWAPTDRPFTITWRDEHGKRHLDRAGDLDGSIARALVRYIDGACLSSR